MAGGDLLIGAHIKWPERQNLIWGGAGLLVLVLVALAFVIWPDNLGEVEKEVAAITKPVDRTKIVVVYTDNDEGKHFIEGVKLAAAEHNISLSGDGTPFSLSFVKEAPVDPNGELAHQVQTTLVLASEIVSDPQVFAVMGHGNSSTAIPASAIYNEAGVLYISTHASDVSLTNHDFDLVFSMQPNNAGIAAAISDFALTNDLTKFVILGDQSDFARQLSKLFASYFASNSQKNAKGEMVSGDILYKGLLDERGHSVNDLVMFLKENEPGNLSDIQAFFLVSERTQKYEAFVKGARDIGITAPIYGPDNLLEIATVHSDLPSSDLNDIVALTIYDPNNNTSEAKRFRARYRESMSLEAGAFAAIGYDAVSLLNYVVSLENSTDPVELGSALKVMRFKKPFIGVTGPIVFDSTGLITDTKVFIIKHDDGRKQTEKSYELSDIQHVAKNLVGPDATEPKKLESSR